MRHVITVLLLLLLYRFVVRVIIPLVRVTRHTANGLRDMEERMRGMEQERTIRSQPKASRPKQGDYIDYEEIK